MIGDTFVTVRPGLTPGSATGTVHGVEQPAGKVWSPTPEWIVTGTGDILDRVRKAGGQATITLKLPTRKYWIGRGEQGTAGAEFQVYLVLDRTHHEAGRTTYRTRHIVTIPIREPA